MKTNLQVNYRGYGYGLEIVATMSRESFQACIVSAVMPSTGRQILHSLGAKFGGGKVIHTMQGNFAIADCKIGIERISREFFLHE